MDQAISADLASSRATLISIAERLGYLHGVAGVTTRALVQESGLSRSNIGYHFGGRHGALKDLYRKLTQDAARWREKRFEAIENAQSAFLTLPATVAGLLSDLTTTHGPRTLLMEEIEDLAVRGAIDLAPEVVAESRAMSEFWRAIALSRGASEREADLWRAMARGVIPLMLVETDAAIRAAEFSVFAERLAQRLARKAPKQRSLPAPVSLPERADDHTPEGKRLIIEAALQLIAKEGVPLLTHRKIAEVAGLSVASTTYFFKSKAEIVTAAFHELTRRILSRNRGGSNPAPLSAIALTEAGEIGFETSALLAWYVAAARDPAFKPFVREVQTAYWGIAVAPVLRSYGITEADRIDCMLANFVAWCAITDTRMLPKSERAAFLENCTRANLAVLFG